MRRYDDMFDRARFSRAPRQLPPVPTEGAGDVPRDVVPWWWDLREAHGAGGSPGPGGLNTGTGGGTGGNTVSSTATALPSPINLTQFLPQLQFAFSGSRADMERALLAIATMTAGMDAAQKNALFSALLPALMPFLQGGGQGFSEEALTGMRGEAIEGTARRFGGVREGLATSLTRRGLRTGSTPISGEALRLQGLLGSEQAMATSGALRDVTTKNEQQRLQNLFQAFNIASGHPANPASSIAAAGSLPEPRPGLGATIGSSFLGSLASTGGQALGTALGDWLSRLGTGRTPPTVPPCAVATELYGYWSPKTLALRLWLIHAEQDTLLGAFLVPIYRINGEIFAYWVRKHGLVREFAKGIFDSLVERAERWLAATTS